MTATKKTATKPAAERAPLPQSGWVATRTLRVGHGFIHGGEIFPDVPTPALVSAGWIERGTGTQPSDPLGGVFDDDQAAAIREALGLTADGAPAAAAAPEPEA
jgi:hypothetical protein